MQNKKTSSKKKRERTDKIFSIAAAVLVLLTVGFFAGFYRQILAAVKGEVSTPVPQGTADSSEQRAALMKIMIAQTRHFKGDANAPVTILEFSDFQ